MDGDQLAADLADFDQVSAELMDEMREYIKEDKVEFFRSAHKACARAEKMLNSDDDIKHMVGVLAFFGCGKILELMQESK